jgi:PAS domain S-box-containing protein
MRKQVKSARVSFVSKKQVLPQTAPYTSASFFALAENAPDIICRFDRGYFHLYVNPAIEKITGIPPSNFIGKATHEVGMAPEFAQFWNAHIQQVFDTKTQVMIEFDFPTPAGTKYFQSSVVPEFDANGDVVSVLSISRDITPIRESEIEKDAFIAMVTHELKTPITTVKVFSQLLEERFRKTSDNEYTQYAVKMDTEVNRLNKLIGDLLDATRIGKGKLQFEETTFRFIDLVKEVVSDMPKITTSHTFTVKKIANGKVIADRDRIRQVLLNLLSNATKYAPDNSVITISTLQKKSVLQCCIHDDGPGIPKEEQNKLFQRFTRLSKSKHPDSPGLGLGLYISSEIIKQSGGEIWVESDDGNGTTFCFTLPLKSPVAKKSVR